ncbi:MAG: type I glutamate--ammonia ligase [Candidatus Hecatellaceae archaeon]
MSMTAQDVLREVKARNIKFIDLHFTDVPGKLHHMTVTAEFLKLESFEDGIPKLDGSSIRGFAEIYESDMVFMPDPNTFAIIPWSPEELKTARLICDIYRGFGEGRFSRDPRLVAQKAEEELKKYGFDYSLWGPEVEFFAFKKVSWDVLTPFKGQGYRVESPEAPWAEESSGYPIRFKEGYYPVPPQDTLMDFRNECVRVLTESFGVLCDAHHHEVATAGQCEIDMYRDTLTAMADSVMTYKYVVRNVAKKYGLVVTFMPKPIFADNGSGMHVHISLWKDGKNAFYDPDDPVAELSQVARYFGGGLLEHSRSLAAIVAPTTNSYRRLIAGYEAPIYIAWSRGNRSANVRIPIYHKGPRASGAKRIEFRTPDPSCNPYLCFAAIMAAGLDGLKRKIDMGDPVDENIYQLTPERRRQLGIKELPKSLEEAVQCLQSDHEYLKPIFSQDLIEKIIEIEMAEHIEVAARPHPYEFHLYFDR